MDRMPCDDVKAAHQQAVLLFRDEHGLLLCAGPAECAGAKPFVKQEKTIALPEELFRYYSYSDSIRL